jgi:hypothetical protein
MFVMYVCHYIMCNYENCRPVLILKLFTALKSHVCCCVDENEFDGF